MKGETIKHRLRLKEGLQLDAETDQLTMIDWHLLPPAKGQRSLPTAVRRCYTDCTPGPKAATTARLLHGRPQC
eukprot:COSAG01_NODE_3069_length_6640_cov_2.893441_5_plen_73_part_00